MSVLEVPGALLHYRVRGRGPVLLLSPGAGGDGDAFAALAEHLASRYMVVTYDRRGFSRSTLDGPRDCGHRLETDADDVRWLVAHLGQGLAVVVGNSSGALVALEVLARHPSAIRTVLAHEPPAVTLLPDGGRWIEFFHEIYDLYRASGPRMAQERFRRRCFPETDLQTLARAVEERREMGERMQANAVYWFKHELRQYPAADLDFATLFAHADRIVPASGLESRGRVCAQ